MPDILAAVAREPHQPLDFAHLQLAEPRPNELVVEVRAAGICHSDLSGRDQLYPFPLPGVLGHEGVGIVRAIGSEVTAAKVGDRVVMSQAFCGECDSCLAGSVTACRYTTELALKGSRKDGSSIISDGSGAQVSGAFLGQSSWATHAIVREPNLALLPEGIPWEVAAPMACGVQTGAGAILNVLQPKASESVVVFGAGTVGLSAVMAAKHIGCEQIVVVDMLEGRLDLARELGATHTVNPSTDDVVAAVHDATGSGADFSVEASGARAAGPLAVDSLHGQGTCILLGTPPFGTKIELDWIGIVSGRTVLGAPFGGGTPTVTIGKLLDLRAAGALPVEKLVRTYPFADIEKAIADMESGATIKPVLLFDELD
ncbi:alcohol dehydrogenase [Williamsia sp. 1138]|uniref:NAD(P)-dependent alcohol dehydrogenase n=1 Tax=Williamsia sp. 1138 TaxID=1903117 RepID=UPI000A1117A2|nr:NAD(P)-dependent alcohol dehydrogenase [Williamsia sp. 1138]OZG26110.1 alcohol dehydrogenase [Williamsia sp. 1138]